MNISYVGPFRLPNYDAGAPRVLNNAKVFRELGHNVRFISWGGKYRDEDLCDDGIYRVDGFEYIISEELPMGNTSLYNRVISKITRGNKTIKILNQMLAKPDLVIMYNADYDFTKKIIRYCKKNNIKIANDINEWFANNELHIIDVIKNHINMTRTQFRVQNKIVISSYLYNYYKNSNNVLIPPLCDKSEPKWYNDVEDERIKPFNGITFIYAGVPTKKDCIYTLLDAVNYLAKKGENIRFIIIGISKDKFVEDYSEHITDNEFCDNIIFLGRIPQELVPCYYKKADFMVMFREPNRKNMAGFPTKVAESITAGVPVITNATSDIDKFIHSGKNGFILNDYSKESIISFIQNHILNLKEYDLNNMKNNAKETSVYFDWHYYEPAFKHFFDNII